MQAKTKTIFFRLLVLLLFLALEVSPYIGLNSSLPAQAHIEPTFLMAITFLGMFLFFQIHRCFYLYQVWNNIDILANLNRYNLLLMSHGFILVTLFMNYSLPWYAIIFRLSFLVLAFLVHLKFKNAIELPNKNSGLA